MNEEDYLTLSTLFKSLPRRVSPPAKFSSPPKCWHSNVCNALEEDQQAEGTKHFPLLSSKKGDIIWAKAFPYTWWPGQVKSSSGRLISISLFGCNKTRKFDWSEILRFEESYPRMLKMIGVKLSREIGLALEELGRSIAVGLKCRCSFSPADEEESSAVKRGFNPQEIIHFVLDKAALPQVVEGEIATVVRISAGLNAFRYDSAICKTSEVDEGFFADGVLEFVHDMAVNHWVDDRVVAELCAFRRFVSVKPDWIYQLDCELGDDDFLSHELEVDLESLDCASEDELHPGRTSDPQEDCKLLDASHKQDGIEMCHLNTMDFSIFDSDEKSESKIHDQPQVDADQQILPSSIKFQCRTSFSSANIADETSTHAFCSSTISEPIISPPNNANGAVTDAICPANAELIISSPHSGEGDYVASNQFVMPNLENTKQDGSISMPVRHKENSISEIQCSAKNLSSSPGAPLGGQLHCLPINKCTLFSPIKVLNHKIEPQSLSKMVCNTSNFAQCMGAIPEMAPFAETALQISANKRKLFEPTIENCESPPQMPFLSSKDIARSRSLLGGRNSSRVDHANDAKFRFSNRQCLYEAKNERRRNSDNRNSKHISQSPSRNHRRESKWKAFYISPLTVNGIHSTNSIPKPLNGSSTRNSSVLLNMKFPKDYTLPSKEELEKKFSVFGPLDRSRTKVFFYTGVGQVIFLRRVDAVAAYNYVTKKKIFGQVNVRFWFYKCDENCIKGSSNIFGSIRSTMNLKSCLKGSRMQMNGSRKNCGVRFSL